FNQQLGHRCVLSAEIAAEKRKGTAGVPDPHNVSARAGRQRMDDSHSFAPLRAEQSRPLCVIPVIGAGARLMIGKEYFARQATTSLRFARAIHDPQVSARLIDRAADLEDKAEAEGFANDQGVASQAIAKPDN